MKLPKGTPPEPTFSKDEVLGQMADPIRRRILEDHVTIADIVRELNAEGLKVTERKLSQMVQADKQAKKERNKRVPPIGRAGASRGAGGQAASGLQGTNGVLNIDRDEDEI